MITAGNQYTEPKTRSDFPIFSFLNILTHFESQLIAPCKGTKTVLDSGFHSVDSGFQYWIQDSLSWNFGFRIPIVSGIPDS